MQVAAVVCGYLGAQHKCLAYLNYLAFEHFFIPASRCFGRMRAGLHKGEVKPR